jgi:uncharacterized protein GlcG (DUF336 family)
MKPAGGDKFKADFTGPAILARSRTIPACCFFEKPLCPQGSSPSRAALAQAIHHNRSFPMLTLVQAQTALAAALSHAELGGLKPLAIAILDARGAQKVFAAQDGTSLKRAEIALGKAHGAVAMGLGSRALHKMALDRPYFVEAATHAVGGSLIPGPGGVLIRDAAGVLLGAVGISGDTSDNDEAAAVAGITAAGLAADTGA